MVPEALGEHDGGDVLRIGVEGGSTGATVPSYCVALDAALLGKPSPAECGVAGLVEQLDVVDVADDVCQPVSIIRGV
jgi:hypothetical protein